MNNKPSYGVIVGRFQVPYLHEGHLELLKTVNSYHQHVIVFLGIAPGGANINNPLDYDTRRRMIQNKFPSFIVCPLVDCSSDETWSENLDKRISEIVLYGQVTLYGGRDSFVPHYKGKYKPVELELKVSHLSGTCIRNEISNKVLDCEEFRQGVIYSINHMYPRVITCVDVAILHNFLDGVKVLLGRKIGETNWRFIGGHADPSSSFFEDDAKREAYEETMLDINSIKYLGSILIDDWRWKYGPDKIKTLFFVAWSNYDKFEAKDDINELKWFSVTNLPYIVPEHVVLLNALLTFLSKEGFL